jgi:hypothetical protein
MPHKARIDVEPELGGASFTDQSTESYDADGVDRSLIRWMLRLTPMERLEYVQGVIDLVQSIRPTENGNR